MLASTVLVAVGVTSAFGVVGSSGHRGAPAPRPKPGAISDTQAKALALNQQPDLDATYHPVAACRLITTATHIGYLVSGHPRAFKVAGTTGFATQGGKSTGCGIPAGATAISANVTTTKSSAQGYLSAYPTGGTASSSRFLTYQVSRTVTATPVLPLSTTSGLPLTLRAWTGKTQVIVDVTGYYQPPIEGLIYTGSTATPTSDGYVYSGSPRLLSVTWVALGIADVTVDRDVTYCTPVANAYYGDFYYANAKAFNGNKIRVYSWSIDPTTHATAFVNNYVYLTVLC